MNHTWKDTDTVCPNCGLAQSVCTVCGLRRKRTVNRHGLCSTQYQYRKPGATWQRKLPRCTAFVAAPCEKWPDSVIEYGQRALPECEE